MIFPFIIGILSYSVDADKHKVISFYVILYCTLFQN